MHSSRKIIVGMIALLLLVNATIASADPRDITEKQHLRETTTFSMKAGPAGCPSLPTNLEGTGESRSTITTTTFANKSRQVTDDREVNGNVVDPSGKSRKFQYIHHTIFSQSADGAFVHVDMTDSFVIKDKGRTNFLEVRFHWLWTYMPADPTALPTATTMPWPPVDNWVQLESGGDPLHCDPI